MNNSDLKRIPGVVPVDVPARIKDEIPFGIDLEDQKHKRECLGQCRRCRCNHGGKDSSENSFFNCTCKGVTEHHYLPVAGEHENCEPELHSGAVLIGSWTEDESGAYVPDQRGSYAAVVCDDFVEVRWSRFTQKVSPSRYARFPGRGDLETEGELLTYTLPPELWFKEW